MNKKELIEKYEYMSHACFRRVDTLEVLRDLKQLDEPQKVVVPQFVAEWYEKHKYNLEFNIFDYVYRFEQQAENDFKDWFDDFKTESFKTLVNMRQFGYEIEEEKRYRVEMKGISSLFRHLKYNLLTEKWYMGNDTENEDVKKTHTRKELEDAGFGWVFDCEGVEVEEVEG